MEKRGTKVRRSVKIEVFRALETRTRRRCELPYEITEPDPKSSIDDDDRKEPANILRKIYASLQGSEQKDKKSTNFVNSGLKRDQNKKSGKTDFSKRPVKKSAKGQQSEGKKLEKRSETSTTDRLATSSGNSIQLLRCHEENRRPLSRARDSFMTARLHPAHATLKTPGQAPNSPHGVKEKRSLCETRGCKQRRSKVEVREAETDVNVDLEELITKIQELKKNVEELEIAKRNAILERKKLPKVDAISQTNDRFITDLPGVWEALGNCSKDLKKLRKFLQTQNCLDQIEERKKNKCCDETTAHIHTMIDGLEALVKFPLEKLGDHSADDRGSRKSGQESQSNVAPANNAPESEKPWAERGLENFSQEAKRGEAKAKIDVTRAELCTSDETHKTRSKPSDRRKIAGDVDVHLDGAKDARVLRRESDSKTKNTVKSKDKLGGKREESKVVPCPGNSQYLARSREAWYGKSSTDPDNELHLETFTSENAPRIKSSGRKTKNKKLDSKPVRMSL